jgi:hypothetical protein
MPKRVFVFKSKRSCHNVPRLPRPHALSTQTADIRGGFDAKLLGMETNGDFLLHRVESISASPTDCKVEMCRRKVGLLRPDPKT